MRPTNLLTLFAVSLAIATASADEPRTTALVPGLTITRLPVTLKNIDSLAYAPDGKLYAAGYDGTVHVLTDTDGDGLEDESRVYWSKPGDLLTPVGMLANDDGVYVAARGKIALLKDTDSDGVADKSETVASGWTKEKYNGDTRNDAAGVAIDADGNLYFSLGCMSYNKAWLLDDDGKSHYDPSSERGTILKVSPDRKKREIVATGLRFVIGLDFNRHGDLFATDQEGDTWFPGGNPRDELLHIIPGRHYGFPFRHPQYLPDSVDEPEVVGFSPQHQSTCGFRFNEQRIHRKPFGPDHWDGNAIVTGFSRGKLWRVPLAKTRAGYVGRQVQFAAFESLLTDVAISPAGDLLVTGHSGKPDWGAGPGADGYLYKIRYDKSAPQPVAVWTASPLEVKVAFDRPVNPDLLQTPKIEMGEFVWEGDSHEWIFPGYEVVKNEKRALRRPVSVTGTQVSDDGRTITFTTTGQPWRSRYGITLPGVAATKSKTAGDSAVEVSFDMHGVAAEWTPTDDDAASWSGWLPHVDSNVIETMTAGSATHEQLQQRWKQPGELRMHSRLLLPGQDVTFRFEGSGPFSIHSGDIQAHSEKMNGRFVAQFSMNSKADPKNAPQAETPRGGREEVRPGDEVDLEITLQTGQPSDAALFDVSYHADFDPNERPLRLEHLFVPWAPVLQPPTNDETDDTTSSEIVGDPQLGRKLFFSEEAKCSVCHTHGDKGGKVAADLTVSVQRSTEAVLRDIVEPSAAINPDYVSYVIQTAAGKTLTGLVKSADEHQIVLVDAAAKLHVVRRANVEDIRASSVSLMPTGFDKLGKDKLQNLVAFLCSEDVEAKRKGLATGVIQRDYWLKVPDGPLSALTNLKSFPKQPTGSGLLTRFEAPVNWKDFFGTRIHGYIHPPTTGDYTFWMAADDHAELWLSDSEDPGAKQRIVRMNRWTPSRKWDKYPEQQSKPIRLEAGRRYYIEALQIESRVDDCLAVGWQLPDGTMERPMPGRRLSTVAGDDDGSKS